jgi:Tfp pilus assembly protein PilP
MATNLDDLRQAAVDKFQAYLIEREKTRTQCKDLESWKAQQYAEMQAEHAWLNAKQAYEIELYSMCENWEPVPLPKQ